MQNDLIEQVREAYSNYVRLRDLPENEGYVGYHRDMQAATDALNALRDDVFKALLAVVAQATSRCKGHHAYDLGYACAMMNVLEAIEGAGK